MSQPLLNLQYVDRPDIPETYVDLLQRGNFDSSTNTFRLEFCTGRLGDPVRGKATGKKYTACRLVIPLDSMLDMLNQLNVLAAQLEAEAIFFGAAVTPLSDSPH